LIGAFAFWEHVPVDQRRGHHDGAPMAVAVRFGADTPRDHQKEAGKNRIFSGWMQGMVIA